MTLFGGVCLYLLVAAVMFFFNYANAVDFNFRVNPTRNLYKEALRLLKKDYLQVHCLWSWKRSVRYRIADLKESVGEDGREHKNFGQIQESDLENEAMHEVYACHCYESRFKFWIRGIAHLLFAPLMLVVIILAALFVDIAMAVACAKEAKKEKKTPIKTKIRLSNRIFLLF